MKTLIYQARVANKTIKIWREGDKAPSGYKYSSAITGGGWNKHTFPTYGFNKKMDYLRYEIGQSHPRAKWHVVLDNTVPPFE